jgi:hypothetical protein
VKNGKSFSEDTGRRVLQQDKATIHPWREPTSSFPLQNGWEVSITCVRRKHSFCSCYGGA